MRLTRFKLFKKTVPYGKRDYFILLFRHLLSHHSFILFLSYEGDRSYKLNALRYLAANHGVTVRLLLSKWVSSIFSIDNSFRVPFQSSLLAFYSTQPQDLLNFFSSEQLCLLTEDFPFFALSERGLLSQRPLFFTLQQPKSFHLFPLMLFSKKQLPLLWYFLLVPLVGLLRALSLLLIKIS